MLDFGFASESEIRTELGVRLHAQRMMRELSQADLAERAGISISTVKLIESKGRCTLENFVRIVAGLGLTDDLQSLFIIKPKSIAQMEQTEKTRRRRAPRKPRAAL